MNLGMEIKSQRNKWGAKEVEDVHGLNRSQARAHLQLLFVGFGNRLYAPKCAQKAFGIRLGNITDSAQKFDGLIKELKTM